jgi:hypothetical protein
MAVRQYTREDLILLRQSPLVSKPEHLPAIEQWIEYVYLETGDGKREKLRIPHSEGTATTNPPLHHDRHKSGDAPRNQRLQRTALGGVGAGGEASPMGAFSTGRPTIGSRSTTLRNANGGEHETSFHLVATG